MKQRVEEMEREAKKLRELQAAAENAGAASGGEMGDSLSEGEDKTAADGRSIYVGNVCFYISSRWKHDLIYSSG